VQFKHQYSHREREREREREKWWTRGDSQLYSHPTQEAGGEGQEM
jgi:hypothetical protein